MMQKNLNARMRAARKNATKKVDNGLIDYTPGNQFTTTTRVTEEDLIPLLPILEEYYQYWVLYADCFLELFTPINSSFQLVPLQRLVLREMVKNRSTFVTACRGFSKSFLANLAEQISCIQIPAVKRTITAPAKNQAISIGREKFNELFGIMPRLKQEVDYRRGSNTNFSDDYIRLVYKNKSELDVSAIKESTRGGRRHGVLVEEVKDIPKATFNAVIIPMLAISRRLFDGTLNPSEPNQQQIYIGSAGYMHDFGYEKAVETLIRFIINPKQNFYCGVPVEVPLFYGFMSQDFLDEIRNDPSFSEEDYSREFGSIWSSNTESSIFDFNKLLGMRNIRKALWERKPGDTKRYYCSIDVGRTIARTVITVYRIQEHEQYWEKQTVNIIVIPGRDFINQAVTIHQVNDAFQFEEIIIDANGMGVGLLDNLTKPLFNPNDGKLLPALGLTNPKEHSTIEQMGAPLIYGLKTGNKLASEIHDIALKEISNSRVRFLVNESDISDTITAQSVAHKIRLLQPYKNTSLFMKELQNLEFKNVGGLTKLQKVDSGEEKDTFSSFEYGMFLITMREQEWVKSKHRKRINLAAMTMGSRANKR